MNQEVESVTTPSAEQSVDDRTQHLKQMAFVGYGLLALSLLIPIACIATVILAYIQLGSSRGHWVETHYRWQIKTFWIALVAVLVGFILVPLGIFSTIGSLFVITLPLVFFGVVIWFIYRFMKGFILLSRGDAI